MARRTAGREAPELDAPDRRGDVRHTVVVSEAHVFVALPLSVVAEAPRGFGDRGDAGRQHSAFAGREILCRIERKRADLADRPGRNACPPRADRLAGVLDHADAARP